MSHIPLYFLQESIITHQTNPKYNPRLSSTLLEAMKYEISKGNYIQEGSNVCVTPRVQMTVDEVNDMIKYFEQQHIFCKQDESNIGFIQCRFLEKY